MSHTIPHHPWSAQTTDVIHNLSTNPKEGLSSDEAAKRLITYGDNDFSASPDRSPISIFFDQLKSPLIIILWIAVLLTLLFSKWLDASIITFAILVNAVFGFIQEYRAERAIADLRSYITERTRVLRDGREQEIDPRYLVPGDIIHVTNGARITADARIISEVSFTANEAILTGESLPVEKQTAELSETTSLPERTNMMFAGTLGNDGSAYAVVTATGNNTEIGKLAKLVTTTAREKTPLQKALGELTWVIIVVTSILVTILFGIGLLNGQDFYDMAILSIAVLVGSVPEALPIGLTAVLAIGVERIAKRKGIMRSLTAAETLGSTTLIITDKTGTLTQADMKLVGINTTADLLNPDFVPGDTQTEYSDYERTLLTFARSASDVVIENPDADPAEWNISGAALEVNIVRAAALQGIKQDAGIRSTIAIRIPFSSKYKFSVTRIPLSFLTTDHAHITDPHIVMGAPDILIARSTLSPSDQATLLQAIKKLSEQGRRILGVGLFEANGDTSLTPEEVTNVTILGLLSFYDPIRTDVPAALTRITEGGVRVIMATGDLPGTARAVARELGWEVVDNQILTGQQLAQLTDADLTRILPRISVYARVTPEDKLRITRLHQNRGEIVAMTGDGVNDAPSLNAANIGIAVGSGSDVAKGVADLVLLDNSFNTIVAAIEEGKNILNNIKKTFVYLMSNSLDELILVGGAIVMGTALPLTAAQIIWVNLFTGSVPAIAYAFDTERVTAKKHHKGSFFDLRVKFLTVTVSILTSALLLIQYLALLAYGVPVELARSILFACFGMYILVITFSFHNLQAPLFTYPLFDNKVLIWGVVIGLVSTLATIYLPFFQSLFEIAYLPPMWLGFVVIWISMNVAIVELCKWSINWYLKKTEI